MSWLGLKFKEMIAVKKLNECIMMSGCGMTSYMHLTLFGMVPVIPLQEFVSEDRPAAARLSCQLELRRAHGNARATSRVSCSARVNTHRWDTYFGPTSRGFILKG